MNTNIELLNLCIKIWRETCFFVGDVGISSHVYISH